MHLLTTVCQSPKTATGWSGIKINDKSKETKYTLHHSIDMKHASLHVKFEGGFFILFDRELLRSKKRYFSSGMVRPFSEAGF
jgi:hypothetical protein